LKLYSKRVTCVCTLHVTYASMDSNMQVSLSDLLRYIGNNTTKTHTHTHKDGN